jgi:hypothetical protein
MNQTLSTNEGLVAFGAALPADVGPGADPTVWALLWSQSQNALHVERLTDMQQTNVDAFRENRRMDYVPLFIGSRAVVDIVAKAVRPIVHAREEAHVARREVV